MPEIYDWQIMLMTLYRGFRFRLNINVITLGTRVKRLRKIK